MKSSFLERTSDHITTRTIDSAEKGIAVPAVPPFTAQMKLAAEEEPLQARTAQLMPLQRAAGPEEELPVQARSIIQKKGGPGEEEPLQMMPVQKKGEEEELPVQGKSIIQKKGGPGEEEPLQMMPVQKKGEEEELPLQGKSIIQKKGDEEEPLQMKAFQLAAYPKGTVQREEAAPAPNRTGMPDNLKSGIENLSGFSMDDVKVHYGSSKPGQLNAYAYAQGTDIHIAPGQEKHLPHEAWHVVQQRQGRVKPTIQAKGIAINDDKGLEAEADAMGARALNAGQSSTTGQLKLITGSVAQLTAFQDNLDVQALKPRVDALEALITAGTLATKTLVYLQTLESAVSRSITLRTRLAATLGTDPGHAARIPIEQGFLTAVQAEIATKQAAAAVAARAAENARLAAGPSLLTGRSNWAAR